MAMVTASDTSNAPANTAVPPAVPLTARDPRLDFYRGIAMFIILFAHTPGNFFTSWIPARWGFSDATEIFVFCSGMASAIAFGRTYDRVGWTLGTARVGYRVWQVYWAHLGMFFFIAMMMAFWDSFGIFEKEYIGTLNLVPFFEGVTRNGVELATTADNVVGIFTLTYVPNYFDILPMYMVILAMMPIVVALSRVNLWLMGAVIVTVWLFAQGHLLEYLGVGHLALDLPAEPWSDRQWFFNPFGWQLAFFTGFALMRGWIPAPPVNRLLIIIAAFIVVANIPLSNVGIREFGFDWARDWRIANKGWINKSDFGILRYVHFLALAYLGWVVAGDGGKRLIADGVDLGSRIWAQVVAFIMKVGQQSLAIFIFSMIFARIMGFIMDQTGRGVVNTVLVNLLGVGLMIVVAYGVAWVKAQPWRAKAAK